MMDVNPEIALESSEKFDGASSCTAVEPIPWIKAEQAWPCNVVTR
jgi:hypothetical protein